MVESLTPGVFVDVLLADEEESGVEGGEDEAVVSGLPGELDVRGVGDSGHGDAVLVFDRRTQRLGNLLLPLAPEGGQEGEAGHEEGGRGLEEGEAGASHLLH